MTAALAAQVDTIGDGVRRVARLADDLAAAAVDLSELWDHDAVHEAAQAAFRAQDAVGEVSAALARLEEVAR